MACCFHGQKGFPCPLEAAFQGVRLGVQKWGGREARKLCSTDSSPSAHRKSLLDPQKVRGIHDHERWKQSLQQCAIVYLCVCRVVQWCVNKHVSLFICSLFGVLPEFLLTLACGIFYYGVYSLLVSIHASVVSV